MLLRMEPCQRKGLNCSLLENVVDFRSHVWRCDRRETPPRKIASFEIHGKAVEPDDQGDASVGI